MGDVGIRVWVVNQEVRHRRASIFSEGFAKMGTIFVNNQDRNVRLLENLF
ncbi:hypothetical protein AA106556_0811 [Neokomagataea tanensis NBRC 106556]|uniref:Transposase n=1 Tax=Neokomagataea tanensis NBRC 106556 TaxID=1223519 RepID=A0ABQ0QI18_9PROT|nr:hypothetical protein AA106556_0811 [Neokomagataea tanensis NBRC 106556]